MRTRRSADKETLEWVAKSRKASVTKKQPKTHTPKQPKTKNSELHVAHGMKSLEPETSVILTLADADVLDDKADTLEHVGIAEQQRRTESYANSKKRPAQTMNNQGLVLHIQDVQKEELPEGGFVDISATQKVADDYYTPNEIKTFRKRKRKHVRSVSHVEPIVSKSSAPLSYPTVNKTTIIPTNMPSDDILSRMSQTMARADQMKTAEVETGTITISDTTEFCRHISTPAVAPENIQNTPTIIPHHTPQITSNSVVESSLAATLEQARQRNMIAKQANDEVNIVYKDAFGRELSPKGAFKELSRAFHGKQPGKKKQEKRLAAYQQELRTHAPVGTSALTDKLKATQQKTGQAFIRLDGGPS